MNRLVVACLCYVFVTTLYGFWFFGFTSNGESLIWKSLTNFISLALLILAVINIDYEVSKSVTRAIYVAFSLVVLGFCFSNPNPFHLPSLLDNSILHFTILPDLRPRGLSMEPSEFSITAITLGLLTVHVTKARTKKIALFFITISLLVLSGSKGGIFTLFLCAIIWALLKWHSRWYQILAFLCIALPLGSALIWVLPNLFPQETVSATGTVPTRVSMLFCALLTVQHHPFGVGLSGFLPAVVKYLPGAMRTTQSLSPFPLDFSEASAYLTSSEMVSTKTFVFDQLMRFGIPFGILFITVVYTILRRLIAHKQAILSIAVLAATIALTTYISSSGAFAIPIVLGIAVGQIKLCAGSY